MPGQRAAPRHRGLDHHDVRAGIRQQLRAVCPGKGVGQVHDAHALECHRRPRFTTVGSVATGGR